MRTVPSKHRRPTSPDREVYVVDELPAALAEAIARVEMDPEHAHLDALLQPER